jgi:hypothetical protein
MAYIYPQPTHGVGKIMKLADVVQILPGVPFRSRIEGEREGTHIVVQARDLTGDGGIQIEAAAKLSALPGSRRVLLQVGDLVLQPRGTRFSVGRFGGADLPAVAAAPLLILRSDARRISPEFLAALLLSPSTQAILKQSAVGTYVPQVPRHAIEALHIDLPDLASQTRLADIARLDQRETEVMDRLREMRGRLFDLAVKETARKQNRAAETGAGE